MRDAIQRVVDVVSSDKKSYECVPFIFALRRNQHLHNHPASPSIQHFLPHRTPPAVFIMPQLIMVYMPRMSGWQSSFEMPASLRYPHHFTSDYTQCTTDELMHDFSTCAVIDIEACREDDHLTSESVSNGLIWSGGTSSPGVEIEDVIYQHGRRIAIVAPLQYSS